MKKVKILKKSLRRNKTTEGVLLQDSSSSVFNIKEVFYENDTREVGCVHSDVYVKEEELDNSISIDDDDCFLSYNVLNSLVVQFFDKNLSILQ